MHGTADGLPAGVRAAERWRWARTVLVGALLAGLAGLAGCSDPGTSVYTPVASIAFPDPALGACARETAQTHGWPTAGRVEMLHCSGARGPKITSLEGIEVLGNLTDLSLAHNQVRDVQPLLGLRKLARLDLGFNSLQRIDALPWTQHLDLNHNQLADLSFVALSPNIRTLLVEYNRIEDLRPLRGLEFLVELQVSGNRITGFDGIEQRGGLKYLGASNNLITSVETLAGLQELVGLQLAGNGIADVRALAGLVELRNLDLSRNRITDVAPLAELVNLKVLKLSDNPIRNVTTLVDLSELHELDVHGIRDLTCDDLAMLRRAFSERVVSADLVCPAGPDQARP